MKRLWMLTSAALVFTLAVLDPVSRPSIGVEGDDTVTSLMGLRREAVAQLLAGPPSPGFEAAVETFFDDDRRCAESSDCIESIDSPHEAYALACHLYSYWNDTLRHPIRREDLAKHRDASSPVAASEAPAIAQLHAEEKGALLRENTAEFRETFWRSHLQANRAAILAAVRNVALGSEASATPRLMVLGAGGCSDIPLLEMARRFEIVLVDIDAPSMRSARSGLPEDLRSRVSLEVRDLSGGIVLRHAEEFMRIIDGSKNSQEAMDRLAERMESAAIPTPFLEGEHRVDALISSMLVSQIPYYLLMQIVESLGDSTLDLEGRGWTPRFAAAVRRYCSRLDDAHAEGLRDYCLRTGGIVYYSSDLSLRHSVLEFGKSDAILPELEGARLQSLWHEEKPVVDLACIVEGDSRFRIIENFEPWIWEHLHPLLQRNWSAVRTERLCAPMRADSCWTAGPRRFKIGRRFVVDAVAFTRQ